MRLYEVDAAIEQLFVIDPETGEVNFDEEAFAALQVEREKAIEGLALYAKNLRADAAAYKAEKLSFDARQKHAEKVLERVETALIRSLNGEKFRTAKAEISFRKSVKVQYDPTLLPPIYWKEVEPKADLLAVKAALKAGTPVAGAWLEDNLNIQIK